MEHVFGVVGDCVSDGFGVTLIHQVTNAINLVLVAYPTKNSHKTTPVNKNGIDANFLSLEFRFLGFPNVDPIIFTVISITANIYCIVTKTQNLPACICIFIIILRKLNIIENYINGRESELCSFKIKLTFWYVKMLDSSLAPILDTCETSNLGISFLVGVLEQ